MNSLPPELLSSIIEQAAQCDSYYDSYRSRLRNLSALSLVNRTFRELAQPLLPQKVWFENENELEEFKKIGKMEEVASLKYEHKEKNYCRQNFEGFSFMTELRIRKVYEFDIMSLTGHQQLKRLSFEEVSLLLRNDFEHFALPNVEEVSLEAVAVLGQDPATSSTTIRFLASPHFPSLRSAGLTRCDCFEVSGAGVLVLSSIDHFSNDRVECMSLGEGEWLDWIRSSSSSSESRSLPILFDLDLVMPEIPSVPILSFSTTSLRQRYARVRIPSNVVPMENALILAESLLVCSSALKELYLDLGPLALKSDFRLEGDLKVKLGKLEELAREKDIEIILENHSNDWVKSWISEEFWRRCRERRETVMEME